MRLLILSEAIEWQQGFANVRYSPPDDVDLTVGNLNETTRRFSYSVFDFDVSVIHIHPSRYNNSIGYYHNIPKVYVDSLIALDQGRTIIFLPHSNNFKPETSTNTGDGVYEWLKKFEIALKSNEGVDIKPTGAGRAHAISEYLEYTIRYYQIALMTVLPEKRLAVVDDTEIVVGLEQSFSKGTVVILPPPVLHDEHYQVSMSRLVDVAQRYYDRVQRSIPVGDSPEWLSDHLVPEARTLGEQIEEQTAKKSEYDRFSYVLYGTGDDLENSVALLLEQFGLEVERQPPGANIDLKAKHRALDIGFAIEITGTKGVIQKDSSKVGQAWQYLKDRAGTSEENDRLIIIANTEYHLNPNQRKRESFTPALLKLVGDNALLMTTLQLYDLWKELHAKRTLAEDILKELHSKSGLY